MAQRKTPKPEVTIPISEFGELDPFFQGIVIKEIDRDTKNKHLFSRKDFPTLVVVARLACQKPFVLVPTKENIKEYSKHPHYEAAMKLSPPRSLPFDGINEPTFIKEHENGPYRARILALNLQNSSEEEEEEEEKEKEKGEGSGEETEEEGETDEEEMPGLKIGIGGYSSIYVLDSKTVVKRIKHESRQAKIFAYRAEVEALRRISSPRIIEMFDYFSEGQFLYIVLENMAFPLSDVRRRGYISDGYACRVIFQILTALKTIHAAGIIHRDIKPDNIMSKKSDGAEFKIIDFGGSCSREDKIGIFGTPGYLAPEVIGEYNEKVDIWAFGISILSCVSDLPTGSNYGGMIYNLCRGHLYPGHVDSRAGVGEGIKAIIKECLDVNPKKRPSAQELLKKFEKVLTQ